MGERSGFLDRGDGERIAWREVDGDGPTVVWLGGFRSDMGGTKAVALAEAAQARGWRFLRFDYYAHGESSGDWNAATIGRWRADSLAVIDQLTDGPLVLVGSSMGGWVASLAALARPERVKALVLIAPAPDFTEALMRPAMSPEALRELELNGVWLQPSEYDAPYAITKRLLDEGRDWLVLDKPVPIRCPVRILQGEADPDVPWAHALALAQAVETDDVVFTLIKAGDHRLSRPQDLERLVATVAEVR
ncbi:alpha/beta hydrolase [Caulobacter sp. 17J65-9]|uniref:alpha/beta fold hydrolase n=1 Tax=Caulobacter sp. 17J65-9 TaxID=2709382 RepID=UPI0013CAE635|nr:alpha/beta hydrolase [Caulobacter sp. 17J65-9]NEX94576.1 alpha/beta hydrolase [Caulobacter sp. 17J65-9]